MKVKDIDKLIEQLHNDKREAFTRHQVWLMLSEYNTEVPTIELVADGIELQKVFDVAIEALEQELDKIRAEIDNINLNEVATKYEDSFYGFQREVINILDKYKAETSRNMSAGQF